MRTHTTVRVIPVFALLAGFLGTSAVTQNLPRQAEQMVLVPAGEFVAGLAAGQVGAKAWPRQVVSLAAFQIDRTEVTNAQFAAFLATHPEWAKGKVPRTKADGRYLIEFAGTAPPAAKRNHPVVFVSWFAADAFCAASGKRLPRAAEWEKAARGNDERLYPWGNAVDGTRANFCDAKCGMAYRDTRYDDGHSRLAPVGSYPKGASPYGALDMSGNASEWVSDWLDRTNAYYQRLPANPPGPESGKSKVTRGGSYADNENISTIRVPQYHGFPPVTASESLGFRCAKDASR